MSRLLLLLLLLVVHVSLLRMLTGYSHSWLNSLLLTHSNPFTAVHPLTLAPPHSLPASLLPHSSLPALLT
jgi:hypothetical protein